MEKIKRYKFSNKMLHYYILHIKQAFDFKGKSNREYYLNVWQGKITIRLIDPIIERLGESAVRNLKIHFLDNNIYSKYLNIILDGLIFLVESMELVFGIIITIAIYSLIIRRWRDVGKSPWNVIFTTTFLLLYRLFDLLKIEKVAFFFLFLFIISLVRDIIFTFRKSAPQLQPKF